MMVTSILFPDGTMTVSGRKRIKVGRSESKRCPEGESNPPDIRRHHRRSHSHGLFFVIGREKER
jgi:hypothetical protein